MGLNTVHTILGIARTGTSTLCNNISLETNSYLHSERFNFQFVHTPLEFRKGQNTGHYPGRGDQDLCNVPDTKNIYNLINYYQACTDICKVPNSCVKILANEFFNFPRSPIKFFEMISGFTTHYYYSIRLNHVEHIKSFLVAQSIKSFNNHLRKDINSFFDLTISEDTVKKISSQIIYETQLLGYFYSLQPGKLLILEEWGNDPYANKDKFIFNNVFDNVKNVNILEIFNQAKYPVVSKPNLEKIYNLNV